eukprot:3399520-Rhodomonas_salina.1
MPGAAASRGNDQHARQRTWRASSPRHRAASVPLARRFAQSRCDSCADSQHCALRLAVGGSGPASSGARRPLSCQGVPSGAGAG